MLTTQRCSLPIRKRIGADIVERSGRSFPSKRSASPKQYVEDEEEKTEYDAEQETKEAREEEYAREEQ